MESRGFASLPHERFALFGLSGKGWPVRQGKSRAEAEHRAFQPDRNLYATYEVDLPVLAEAQAI
jgi:hypothetical protein